MGGRRDRDASPLRRARGAVLALAVIAAAVVGESAAAKPHFRLTVDGTGVIPFFIAQGVEGSGYRPADRDLATWALQEWSAASAVRCDSSESTRRMRQG